jgi:Tfp pilus assembly protein PilF
MDGYLAGKAPGLKGYLFRAAVVAAVIVLALGVTACKTASKRNLEVESLYKFGMSHLVSGKNQAAFVKFHEALQIDPDHKESLNGLGYVYLGMEEYEKAAEHFGKAIAIDDSYSEAYNNLCFTYYNLARYQEAISTCEKAVENPLYATPEKAYYNMGRSYYKMGKHQKAVESLDQGLKRHPNFFQGYYAMALAYNALRQHGKASEAMGLAIGLDPRFQGDKQLAENKLRELKREGVYDPKEVEQYIQILHY